MKHQLSGVLIYGAGGHGKVVADIVERQAQYRIVGFVDDNSQLWGKELLGYKVLGGLPILVSQGLARHPIVIAIGDNRARKRLVLELTAIGCTFTSVIHPSAQIASNVQVGLGAMVMANVAINPDAKIGAHVIVNTGAVVEHDCVIHDFVHISPAAVLAGNVVVKEGSHIGMGCSILPGVQIGAYSIVGAGAVVTKNIAAEVTAVGIPAKPLNMFE